MARVKRSELHEIKMPKWIWQLHMKGFHLQLKKYLHFLWRSRPHGCTWSRALRARYFKRSVSTVAKWDRFLLDNHLVWVSGMGTMLHRIGARPYFQRDVWVYKRSEYLDTVRVAKVQKELTGDPQKEVKNGGVFFPTGV